MIFKIDSHHASNHNDIADIAYIGNINNVKYGIKFNGEIVQLDGNNTIVSKTIPDKSIILEISEFESLPMVQITYMHECDDKRYILSNLNHLVTFNGIDWHNT